MFDVKIQRQSWFLIGIKLKAKQSQVILISFWGCMKLRLIFIKILCQRIQGCTTGPNALDSALYCNLLYVFPIYDETAPSQGMT